MRGLGTRLLSALNPPDEVDELALDLAIARRRQQLLANFRRVERLLTIDMSMSATRQLGNRLAFAWLARELEQSRGSALPWWLDDDCAGRRPDPRGELGLSSGLTGQPGRHAPTVEILDTGRRR